MTTKKRSQIDSKPHQSLRWDLVAEPWEDFLRVDPGEDLRYFQAVVRLAFYGIVIMLLIAIVLLMFFPGWFMGSDYYSKPAEDIKLRVGELIHPKLAEAAVVPRWSGTASYYSRKGCLGCNKALRMANGETLDDSKLTLAFNHAKLNTKLRIVNPKNGKSVIARVTDRGGFNAKGRAMSKVRNNGLNRIADLSVATRNAIGCSNLCQVQIYEVK